MRRIVNEKCAHYRHYRSGWLLFGRVLTFSKGYEIHGLIRRASTVNTHRIDHFYKDPHVRKVRLHLHYGDLSDSGQLTNLIYNIKPDEIFHLGAQSHVRVSFDIPEYTGDITEI